MPTKRRRLTKQELLERKCDRLAVRIVSIVSREVMDGYIPAYGGILAAREIKRLLISKFNHSR